MEVCTIIVPWGVVSFLTRKSLRRIEPAIDRLIAMGRQHYAETGRPPPNELIYQWEETV